jgi:hypothetical protein
MCESVCACVIMETERYYDLLSASWKPRKAGGIIWDLRGGEPRGVDSSQVLRPENQECQRQENTDISAHVEI